MTAATIIGGIAVGGALVGGILAAVDPLKVRATRPLGPGEADALPTLESAQAALSMLGYFGEDGVSHFQEDVNEIRDWHRAMADGNERMPPDELGYTQVPPVLQRLASGATNDTVSRGSEDVPVDNQLVGATMDALREAVGAVIYSSGQRCMTAEGEAIEADAHACLDAWRHAVIYAEAANAASTTISPGLSATIIETDEWGQPTNNTTQAEGSHGPFLWRTYKDNTGRFNHLFYFVTWHPDRAYEAPQGPFNSAAQAESAKTSYIESQLGNGNGNGGGPGFSLDASP